MFQQIRKWKWIIFAVICFLLLYILPASFIEHYYSEGCFLWIRKFLDNSFGKLPFPSYYLFLLFLFVIILKWFLHFFREKPQPVLQRLFRVLSFISFMAVLFFLLWGFNYGRLPMEQKLHLDIYPLTQQQLIAETDSVILKLESI